MRHLQKTSLTGPDSRACADKPLASSQFSCSRENEALKELQALKVGDLIGTDVAAVSFKINRIVVSPQISFEAAVLVRGKNTNPHGLASGEVVVFKPLSGILNVWEASPASRKEIFCSREITPGSKFKIHINPEDVRKN